MSSSSRTGGGRWIRRIGWALLVLLVLVVAAYGGAWFYFAHKLKTGTEQTFAGLNNDAVSAECTDAGVRGFPMRIGLACAGIAYEDRDSGLSVTTGAFRYGFPLLNPTAIVGRLEAPARIEMPPLEPVELTWKSLRAALRLGVPLPERLSIEARALAAAPADGGGEPAFTAEAAAVDSRPVDRDMRLGARFEGLELARAITNGIAVPRLDGRADVTVDDGVQIALRPPESLRGHSATIHTLSLATGEDTGIALSGPVALDRKGLLDATLTIRISNPDAVAAMLPKMFPGARDAIRTGFATVSALGEKPELQLRIEKGQIFLGFIPLGRIPPLGR